MSLIKKFAAPLAVLCALCLCVAAPYMIPENPDSAVFRSGSLSLLLIAGCAAVAYPTLRRVDLRTLLCGMGVGLLFAGALSIGSELFVYDALLPGMGSLIRRIAVPLLAAPMIGCLVCRFLLAPVHPAQKPVRLKTGYAALLLLICWLPLLLAYFPGMLNYDFAGEYAQHTAQQYTNLHPLLHSVLMNNVIALGTALHSPTLGVLMMTVLQMVCFAFALGYSCAFAARRGAPRWALALMLALYALHPAFSVMALSMTKDTLFAAAVLVLSLDVFALLETHAPLRKGTCLRFVLCMIGTALLRSNGVFALLLLIPGVLICAKGARKRAAALCACGVGAAILVNLSLSFLYKPASMPSFQLYSLPAQQLVRAYNTGEMTAAQRAELEGFYTSEDGLALHPHLADPAKGYLDRGRIETEGDAFLALWQEVGVRNPRVYLEAFLMLNVGSWYPDDLSHATIYPDVSWNDKGYLQTQELDMREAGIKTSCFLPAVYDLYEQICRRNVHQKYPVIALLFSPATPLWGIVLACALLIARRRTRYLPAALGALGLFLSYLMGPCTLVRYALPLFCLAPVLLTLAATARSRA